MGGTTPPSPAPITLLTDFGERGIYVGALKGVIHALHPAARIIDLTHQVTPQAIREGAFLLHAACPYFPPGTVHVAVVDPGVGTARRAVALDVPGLGRFVGPDNGLFTPILAEHPDTEARAISNPEFTIARLGRPTSATFHGRDIFAPAAALLARGEPFTALGSPLDPAGLVRLPHFWASWDVGTSQSRTIHGEVIHIDSFGNLVTNIPRRLFATLTPAEIAAAVVTTTHHTCHGIGTTYGDHPPGTLIALFGSSDSLELARVNARADRDSHGESLTLGLAIEVRLT
jgi:S-adenosylmethionine hydrolase